MHDNRNVVETGNTTLPGSPYFRGPAEPCTVPAHSFQYEKCIVRSGTIAWPNGADKAPETLYEIGIPV